MIATHVIEAHNAAEHRDLLDQMFRLRASVFKDQLGWDVVVTGGMELDRFDHIGPVYIVTSEYNRATGSLRLLPTTGSTLLAEVFADTHPDIGGLMSPEIWECTRVCVRDDVDKPRTVATLFCALGKVCLDAGVSTVVGNVNAEMLGYYRRLGLQFKVHRPPSRGVFLASFPINEKIVRDFERRMAA